MPISFLHKGKETTMRGQARTIAFLAAGMVAMSPVAAFPKEGIDKSITVNPIDLFTGTMNLEYEQAANKVVSLYGGVNFLVVRGLFQPSETRSFGVGPEVGLRLYLI